MAAGLALFAGGFSLSLALLALSLAALFVAEQLSKKVLTALGFAKRFGPCDDCAALADGLAGSF